MGVFLLAYSELLGILKSEIETGMILKSEDTHIRNRKERLRESISA
jgi:hypothetical protein